MWGPSSLLRRYWIRFHCRTRRRLRTRCWPIRLRSCCWPIRLRSRCWPIRLRSRCHWSCPRRNRCRWLCPRRNRCHSSCLRRNRCHSSCLRRSRIPSCRRYPTSPRRIRTPQPACPPATCRRTRRREASRWSCSRPIRPPKRSVPARMPFVARLASDRESVAAAAALGDRSATNGPLVDRVNVPSGGPLELGSHRRMGERTSLVRSDVGARGRRKQGKKSDTGEKRSHRWNLGWVESIEWGSESHQGRTPLRRI
jgi:hypothetical protein